MCPGQLMRSKFWILKRYDFFWRVGGCCSSLKNGRITYKRCRAAMSRCSTTDRGSRSSFWSDGVSLGRKPPHDLTDPECCHLYFVTPFTPEQPRTWMALECHIPALSPPWEISVVVFVFFPLFCNRRVLSMEVTPQ